MAEQEQKKKRRRAYLDAFEKNSSGAYEYKGEMWTFEPKGRELRTELMRLWVLCLMMMAALLAAGCVNAPGTGSCFYVLMPYIIGLIAGVSVCWGLCRLTAGGLSLRDYVYKATVEQIPLRAVLTAICSGVAMAGEIIYFFRNGTDGKLAGGIVFLVLESIILIAAWMVRRIVSDMTWIKG